MHYFVFPSADSWISSGSNNLTGESYKDQNFGQDQILEVGKEFYNTSFDYQNRALINFNGTSFTEMSQSIVNGDIPTDAKFVLKLYESAGNSDLSSEYKIEGAAISESWDEGVGKFGDNPKTTEGCSWENRLFPQGGNATTWSKSTGLPDHGVSTISSNFGSQSFSYNSADINMDITNMTRAWLDGTNKNNGILLRLSGSQETDEVTTANLKFFSRNTHTIYAPRIEVQWDGHAIVTGSATGSLDKLDISGDSDNHIFTIGLKEKYRDTDVIKFRLGARKQYIQKTFSTSFQRASGSFIPEGSGSYAIEDLATGEKVIDFSEYTKLSCDSKSNYFIEHLNGFYPDRFYKILVKVKYDDNQEIIYDNDFEFKIVR